MRTSLLALGSRFALNGKHNTNLNFGVEGHGNYAGNGATVRRNKRKK